MSGFLLDTNVMSDLRKPLPNAGLVTWLGAVDERELFLSVLSIGEIRIGITMQGMARKRVDLETWLVSDLIPRFAGRILPVDMEVAEHWGRTEGAARLGAGKLLVIDSLLAATAHHHNLTVVTNNEADFSRTGTTVINPWT
ncbi:MAG: type II toxin-antitoxin system VapC family toxin [Candidatus Baltobacteraceae bacterium]